MLFPGSADFPEPEFSISGDKENLGLEWGPKERKRAVSTGTAPNEMDAFPQKWKGYGKKTTWVFESRIKRCWWGKVEANKINSKFRNKT